MTARLTRQQLRTVQVVPLTAFDADGSLNLAPMRELTQRLFDAGMRAFIPCAGSAEFHSVSGSEVVEAVGMTSEIVGGEAGIMVPLGQQLNEALETGKRAARAGAGAALIMPLSFPYISDSGARDYYLRLLDELPIPVLIYKKDATPSDALLLELAEHENLIGVKYAVNDLAAYQQVVDADGGRIDWYCGSAERFAPYFALAGSPGYTSGAGNLCPRLTLAMHAALAVADFSEAMRLQRQIVPIEYFRARANNSYNISFLKAAIAHTGLDMGQPRPPQRRLTDAELAEVQQLLPDILEAELAAATDLADAAGR